jgi:hypothetical protein
VCVRDILGVVGVGGGGFGNLSTIELDGSSSPWTPFSSSEERASSHESGAGSVFLDLRGSEGFSALGVAEGEMVRFERESERPAGC